MAVRTASSLRWPSERDSIRLAMLAQASSSTNITAAASSQR
jgi:hypothetical protein